MTDRKSKVLIGVYGSSMKISITALAIVAALEVFMLCYTLVDPALFGEYINTYRTFYVSLLSVAIIYMALHLFVRKDLDHRYKILNIANPICAAFFFAWPLGITFFDAVKYGTVDPTVFMTFSFTVPVSFFLFPVVYAIIVAVADAVLLYGAVVMSGSVAPVINFSIFFIFQIVLGISFLQLKLKLGERIVQEQENADTDALTGFSNRRVYEKDLKKLGEQPVPDDFVYIAIDINGLKEMNDSRGHGAGDKMIIGAAECIEQAFGALGSMYRIGGDEFVMLAHGSSDELEKRSADFEAGMKSWSEANDMELSVAYGYACSVDHPGASIIELGRTAERSMYESKSRYYQMTGRDRRRY